MAEIPVYHTRTTPGGPVGRPDQSGSDNDVGGDALRSARRTAVGAQGRLVDAMGQVGAANRAANRTEQQVAASQASALDRLGGALEQYAAHADRAQKAQQLTLFKARAARDFQVFAGGVEHGGRNQDGSEFSAADPDEAVSLIDSKAAEMRKAAKKELGEDAYAVWEADFDQTVLRQRIELQGRVITKRQKKREVELKTTLDTLADVAADADDATRPFKINEARVAIQEWVRNGGDELEGAKKVQAFQRSVTLANMRRDKRETPEELVAYLVDSNTETPGLAPEERQEWITSTMKEVDERRRARLAAIRDGEQADKDRKKLDDDQAHKELSKLATPTESDVLAREARLGAERFQSWMDRTRKVGDAPRVVSDVHTLAAARVAAAKVRTPEQLEAFARDVEVSTDVGTLEPQHYLALMSVAEGNVYDGKRPRGYSDGRDKIIGITGGETSINPLAPVLRARGLSALAQWADDNPNATPAEYREESDRIANSVSLFANIIAGKLTPRFLVGGKASPDLAATWAATEKALTEGRISKTDAASEIRLIEEWRAALEAANK